MILFKPEHVPMILSGRKWQTRRLGKKRWKVGSIHACYTKPPFARGGATPFCRVRIVSVRQERLLKVSADDALAEGYATSDEFLTAFDRINGVVLDEEGGADPLVWVVAFEVVGEWTRQP